MSVTPITTVPNRPLGTAPRSIEDILADFDHITNYINNILLPGFPVTGDTGYPDFLQEGVVSGGITTRDSNVQVTTAEGAGWVTNQFGILVRVTWADTPLAAIPAGPSNGRVDQVLVDSTGQVSRLVGVGATSNLTDLDDAAAAGSRSAVPSGSIAIWEFIVDNTGVLSTARTEFRDTRGHAVIPMRGEVDSTGTLTSGFGFYVHIDATGIYKIIFNKPMSSKAYNVLALISSAGNGNISTDHSTVNYCHINLWNATGAVSAADFEFFVWPPQ